MMTDHIRVVIGFVEVRPQYGDENSYFIGVFDDRDIESEAIKDFEKKYPDHRTRTETHITTMNKVEN